MLNRSTIMQAAWGLYRRSVYARLPFDRAAFGRALRMAWSQVRTDAAREAENARRAAMPILVPAPRAPTELEALIAGTVYLPSHMSQTRAIAEIRARYA